MRTVCSNWADSEPSRVTTVQPFYRDADYIEALHAVTAPYLQQPHDFLIRHIGTGRYLHRTDMPRWRHAQQLIGDQRQLQRHALGHPVQNLLDDGGTGIGIDPDLHHDSHSSPFGLIRGGATPKC